MEENLQTSDLLIPPVRPWWFVGFHGLVVEENDAPFDFSLFGDVSITSSGAVRSNFSSGGTWPPYWDLEKMVGTYGIQTVDLLEFMNVSIDSFFVIKRAGTWIDAESQLPEVLSRAKEISAVLTILYFVLTDGERVCGMPGELHHWTGQAMACTTEFTNRWYIGIKRNSTVKMLAPFKLKFSDLVAVSESPLAKSLIQIFSGNETLNISQKLRKRIKGCCLRLTHAIRAIDHETRLLSSVIMLEMMMATSKQDAISIRTQCLVGDSVFAAHSGGEVFKARNSYVHNGHAINPQIAAKALSLSVHALFSFIDAAVKLDRGVDIPSYLDKLAAASLSQSLWDPSEQADVASLAVFSRQAFDLHAISGL